jgi:two-component system, chemotaxis family, protein-glutamate methylesterase/glutaminase
VTQPPIRLLVVDDSAYNRRNIADVFAGRSEVEIVGKAADGEEALRLATLLKPDIITLDLEMPRMDGFTFLRILMSRQPTPVIVVSSYSQKENVFKALELGALDFVAKPSAQIAPDATDLKDQILEKVLLVRQLRSQFAPPLGRRQASGAFSVDGRDSEASLRAASVYIPPKHIVAIASSTGGPSALLEIFGSVPQSSAVGIVVAQHMPDKFTRTFAERLDRRGPVRTSEAQDGQRLAKLTGFVCPGRQCMELVQNGVELKIAVGPPKPEDRYVPSADRLLRSVAAAAGPRAIGVILTGMGDDGVEGARAIRDAGGLVIAESQETAVVYGMPGAAVREGIPQKVLPLPQIAELIAQLPR